MTDPNTRTNEQEVVKTTVETVENVEYQCAVCEQWYDDESDMVAVKLNATPDDRGIYGVNQLCQPCAEGLFDYEGPTYGTVAALRDEARRWTVDDVCEVAKRGVMWPFKTFARLIPVLVTGGVVWGVLKVLPDPETTSSEFEQASKEVSTSMMDASGLLGVVMIVMIFSVIVAYLTGGTRPRY